MKPRQLSPEKKQRLLDWLHAITQQVEAGQVTCVAAYLQKVEGGGSVAIKGELVDADAVYGLNQLVERIQGEAERQKGAS